MTNVQHPRFLRFVEKLQSLVNSDLSEILILENGKDYLQELIAVDDWLPSEYSIPYSQRNIQYLLHLDPEERFSIVSVVWGPGQSSSLHNHTVWGLLGVLRGAEKTQKYGFQADGSVAERGSPELLEPKQIDAVSPDLGDLHSVSNAYDDRITVSIHVYGGNIGKIERSRFQPDGTPTSFISGYFNA